MIYLASPYKHNDPLVQAERYAKACAARDYFLRQNVWVYSPIAHNHPGYDLPRTWSFWCEYDFDMLSRCDNLYVLCLDGWMESEGVNAEISYWCDQARAGAPKYELISQSPACDRWQEYLRIDDVLACFLSWSDATFPQSTVASRLEHARRELIELATSPGDASEYADVLGLINHAANGLNSPKVNLAVALYDKLKINRERKWGDPDTLGVVEHIRDAAEPAT